MSRAECPGNAETPRRQAILDAALQLFHVQGYQGTGMDQIGEAAGITGPGVYRHFRNKEDILATLMRSFAEPIRAELEAIAVADLEPLEALEAITRAVLEALVDHPSLAQVGMYERWALATPTRRWVEAVEARTTEIWVDIVRRVRAELGEPEAQVLVQAAATAALAASSYPVVDREAMLGMLRPMMLMILCGPPGA